MARELTIEELHPTAWHLRLRDHNTGKLHELDLRGPGPWTVEMNGKAVGTQAAPPAVPEPPRPTELEWVKTEREGRQAYEARHGDGTFQLLKAKCPGKGTWGLFYFAGDGTWRDIACGPLADMKAEAKRLIGEPPSTRGDHTPADWAREAMDARAAAKPEDAAPKRGEKAERSEKAERNEKADRRKSDRKGKTSEPAPPPKPKAPAVELEWEEVMDAGRRGFRATFRGGAYKLLRVAGDRYALYYEWKNGKYIYLGCGTLEDLENFAGEHAAKGLPSQPESSLTEEVARQACTTSAAPTPRAPEPEAPPAEPEPRRPPRREREPAPPPPAPAEQVHEDADEPVDPDKDAGITESLKSALAAMDI